MIRLLSFLGDFLFVFVFKSVLTGKRLQGLSNGLGSVSADISKALITVHPNINFPLTPSGRLSCQSTLFQPFHWLPVSHKFKLKPLQFSYCFFPILPCATLLLWDCATDTAQFHSGLNPPGLVLYCSPFFLCKQRCWRAELSPPTRQQDCTSLNLY